MSTLAYHLRVPPYPSFFNFWRKNFFFQNLNIHSLKGLQVKFGGPTFKFGGMKKLPFVGSVFPWFDVFFANREFYPKKTFNSPFEVARKESAKLAKSQPSQLRVILGHSKSAESQLSSLRVSWACFVSAEIQLNLLRVSWACSELAQLA